MANPHAHLTRRTVILAKTENVAPSTAIVTTGTSALLLTYDTSPSAPFVADEEIGKAITVGDEASLNASTQVETRIVVDNTTSTLTLNEALGFTPDAGDYNVFTNYGSASITPEADTDAILTMAPSITVNGEALSREAVTKSLTPIGDIIGNRTIDISFDVELKGSGTSAAPPEIDRWLLWLEWSETLEQSLQLAHRQDQY